MRARAVRLLANALSFPPRMSRQPGNGKPENSIGLTLHLSLLTYHYSLLQSGRLAQWWSISFTPRGSGVRNPHRPVYARSVVESVDCRAVDLAKADLSRLATSTRRASTRHANQNENFHIRLRLTKRDGLRTVLHWLHARSSQETRSS